MLTGTNQRGTLRFAVILPDQADRFGDIEHATRASADPNGYEGGVRQYPPGGSFDQKRTE